MTAYEDEIEFCAQLAVPRRLPVIPPVAVSDPVTPNPSVNEIVPEIYDAVTAVVARDAVNELVDRLLVPVKVPVNDPEKLPVLICNELLTVPLGSIVGAYDAVVENEELIAFVAQLAVPVRTPVNDPVNEPVLICTELDTTPVGNMVGAYEALLANDAVVANDDDVDVSAKVAYDALATEPDWATVTENCVPSPLVKVMVVLDTLAVVMLFVASDALIAFVAQLLVPSSDPVILPETRSDPVMTKPFGKLTNPSSELA